MQKRRVRSTGTLFWAAISILLVASGCTVDPGPLGTAKNPIKLFFVPSVDVKAIEDNSEIIRQYLEAHTPYKYKVAIPTSFIAAVEALGTKRADIVAMNTYGYILAHERYGAEAKLTVIRHGLSTYQGQIVVKANSGIKTLEDLAGKKVAFVDPASTSGYLLPLKILNDKKIKPKDTVFAMRHDNVVSMVYQGQVDAGATFYVPPSKEGIEDARRLVKTQYPDVEEKVKILTLTESIPNDPIVFRKDLPNEIKDKVVNALVTYVRSEKGQIAFNKLYGVNDLKAASDQDYESVRKTLKALGKSAAEMVVK